MQPRYGWVDADLQDDASTSHNPWKSTVDEDVDNEDEYEEGNDNDEDEDMEEDDTTLDEWLPLGSLEFLSFLVSWCQRGRCF